jgi:hypothetical protein
MTKIICDAALREKLHGLVTAVELCDERGHVLARVVPTIDSVLAPSREPQISPEELERRRTQGGKTYTTAEVLAYLEGL